MYVLYPLGQQISSNQIKYHSYIKYELYPLEQQEHRLLRPFVSLLLQPLRIRQQSDAGMSHSAWLAYFVFALCNTFWRISIFCLLHYIIHIVIFAYFVFCVIHLLGLRADSARAVTSRCCPHSGVGEDFLACRSFFFLQKRNPKMKSRKTDPKVRNEPPL